MNATPRTLSRSLNDRMIAGVMGGIAHRNAQEEIKVTTDKKGEFSVTWPEAGMYWLETGSEDKKTSLKQAKTRRLSYVATLEVLPQ